MRRDVSFERKHSCALQGPLRVTVTSECQIGSRRHRHVRLCQYYLSLLFISIIHNDAVTAERGAVWVTSPN